MDEAQNTRRGGAAGENLLTRAESLTKAGAELAWAMTMFGVRQTNSLLRGRPVAAELEEVTRGVTGRFDQLESSLFTAPSRVQRTLIGIAFDLTQARNLSPRGFIGATSNVLRSTFEIAERMVPGCKSCGS